MALTCVFVLFGGGLANAGAPIKIGLGKQLLIDNLLIGSFSNLKRVAHRPVIHQDNPIITGTEPWERWLVGVNGKCVMYDAESREFKMWYGAYSDAPTKPAGQGYRVCYAISNDGIHWTRPSLGQVEFGGTRKNNIISWGENWMRRPKIMKDQHETDPERLYKMTYVDVIGGKPAIAKAFSRDGIRWHLNADDKPWFTNAYNANLLGWDERIQRYVLFRRVIDLQHAIGRSLSRDFSDWSEPEVVLAPGPGELDKNFQGLAAFFYEDVCFGFLSVRDQPRKFYNSELVVSRDGAKWQRFSPGELFLQHGESGSWDSEAVTAVAPVVFGDWIWIYYTGTNYPHSGASLGPVQNGWIKNGLRIQSAIGLANLRLDGFVSLDANDQAGTLTTKTIEAAGELRINANVRGEMRIGILDGSGKPLHGFSEKDCEPIRTDHLRHKVQWAGKSSREALGGGRPIRLRFNMRSASLYAFSFDK
ncbi:MAG: hypothetical protein EXS36_19835 [Pedosphaera sp.]|nr:hypothetical protein [Pedosphaera sp.]